MHEQIKRPCVHIKGKKFFDLRVRKHEEADVCIVGAGAAGGVLADRLSKKGLKVVVIEAGPFWDPQRDFASDELAMQSLGWQDTRLSTGKDPITFGHNNSGRGVGGGTVHFTGVFLRFHESDFRTKTLDGVGEDWPISYQDLEPYYNQLEKEISVSGPKYFPWGAFNGPYPYPVREPISSNAELFRRGCEKLGITSSVTPLAILSAPFKGRPPCINRGFCTQGCLPNAKFSTLIQHLPKAIDNGAEILTDCMVTSLQINEQGRITGVTFTHEKKEYFQAAKIVILASFVVETPRLLLNSACTKYPDGLANSSGLVGKYIMPHSSHDIFARFENEVRMYKGTPVMASTLDFYETDPKRDFVRGYTLHAHGSRPLALAKGLAVKNHIWGQELSEIMRDFNFYARITLVGEVLPNKNNSISLSKETDEYGLPKPLITFSYGENDHRLIKHAIKQAEEIHSAIGGIPTFVIPDTAHLMGGTRMGNDPKTSVVNGFCQSHDIPNLFICSASVFVTAGGTNPTETVMAIAARTADYILEETKKQRI